MRKIIGIGLFVAILVSLFLARVPVANACVQWGEPRCSNPDEPVGGCTGDYITECLAGWEGTGVCPPNTYSCNRASDGYCCPLGAGGGGGGGGGPERQGDINCPAGTVVDYNQPLSTVCSSQEQGYYVGSAQQITGCCREVTIKGACEWISEWKQGREVLRKECAPDETNCAQNYYTTYACKSTCTATAPAAPTLMSPANASSQSSTTASLMWNQVSSWGTACSGANNQYYVYLGTTNPPSYATTVASNVTSMNFGNLTRGTTYYWQIVASNGQLSSNSAVRSFTILNNQIAGTVFYDTANNCGGSGWSTGGVAVSLNGGAGNAVSGTGTFTLTEPLSGPHTLAVSIPAGFICSTTAGCNTCSRGGITSPSANNNFYLTDLREAWWQAEGAGVYVGSTAGGVTIRSELPTALTKLILPGSGGTSAALMRASGQADLGEGSISSEGWSAITRYHGQRMGYQYFAAKMGVIPLQADDWFTNNLDDKPSGDAQEFYYQNGDSIVSNPWVVSSGESYVVFIKGNLRINANITVENGGFLAFIVKGNVNVDPSVTTLQGLYVMDTNFITESDYVLGSVNDVPLDVQGSIVAWGTLSISRNLGAGNSTTPAEKFTWRSDLLANMPRRMKMFLTNWQEVVPGTFGD